MTDGNHNSNRQNPPCAWCNEPVTRDEGWERRGLSFHRWCVSDDESRARARREGRDSGICESYRAVKAAFISPFRDKDGRAVTDVGPAQMVRIKAAIRGLLDDEETVDAV